MSSSTLSFLHSHSPPPLLPNSPAPAKSKKQKKHSSSFTMIHAQVTHITRTPHTNSTAPWLPHPCPIHSVSLPRIKFNQSTTLGQRFACVSKHDSYTRHLFTACSCQASSHSEISFWSLSCQMLTYEFRRLVTFTAAVRWRLVMLCLALGS